jgi:hypothetical protein
MYICDYADTVVNAAEGVILASIVSEANAVRLKPFFLPITVMACLISHQIVVRAQSQIAAGQKQHDTIINDGKLLFMKVHALQVQGV